MKIEFLGHCAVLFTSDKGKRILVDPYITNNVAAKINTEDITDIDALLITHAAFDHLGDSVDIAKRTKCQVFTEPATGRYLKTQGIPDEKISLMIWNMARTFEGVHIRAVEARHWSMIDLGYCLHTGMPLGFILHMENGTGVYFGGDTSVFGDMKLFGELYPVKIGFFGIDGAPGHAFAMDGGDAAVAAKLFGVEVAIPMHYAPGSAQLDSFAQAMKKHAPSVRIEAMSAGDILEFE